MGLLHPMARTGAAAPDAAQRTNKQTLSAQVPSLDVGDLCTLAMVMMCNAHPVGDHYDALYEHGSAINHSCRVGLFPPPCCFAAGRADCAVLRCALGRFGSDIARRVAVRCSAAASVGFSTPAAGHQRGAMLHRLWF